jgi:hypothetical protein
MGGLMAIYAKKGKIRSTPPISVMGMIRALQPKTVGRPKKETVKEVNRQKFKWGIKGKIRGAQQPIKAKNLLNPVKPLTGQSIVDLIRNPLKSPINPNKAPVKPTALVMDPDVVAAFKEVNARDRFIRGKAAESNVFLTEGALMPSSVVEELEAISYDARPGYVDVHVQLDDRQYTYVLVPQEVFDRWFQGKASCITDDVGKMTGKHRKKWIKGKTPSLGAFYNKYIKGKYRQTSGYV